MSRRPGEVVRENHHGVQVLNYKHRPRNLHTVLSTTAQKFPDKTAFQCYSGTKTYEQFARNVDRFAAALQQKLGVNKGDRIAMLLGNDIGFPLTLFAASRIGAVSVPINVRFVSGEIAHILKNSGTNVCVVDPPYLRECLRAKETVPNLEHVVITDSAKPDSDCLHLGAILEQSRDRVDEVDVDENDLSTIFYTAGTMGTPKGAMCTHRNLISNAINTEISTNSYPDSKVLICVPLCHPMGCHSQMITGVYVGSTRVIERHFNADETLSLIGRERITAFAGVPTMFWLMLAQMKLKDYDLSSLENVTYGGAPASPELVGRLREALPGVRLGNGYGLTESSALATFLPDEYAMEKPDSVGPPVKTVEIRITNEQGENLVPGKIGEILLKGPNVVEGYWKDKEATDEAFKDGWFRTGDLGRLDNEGFLYIVDRKKDMIIRGGENIYCVEIENILESHPGVFQAAVVGEPDKVFGEQVKAYIVPNLQNELSADEILDFCDERLADFKVPKYIEFVDSIPRNPGGKVDKSVLRR